MTEAASGATADLSDIEKSAMVMMMLGQETAAQVVKFLSQPEINRLSMAMTRIAAVRKETAAAVLGEFAELMHEDEALSIGSGDAYIRGVLEKALGLE